MSGASDIYEVRQGLLRTVLLRADARGMRLERDFVPWQDVESLVVWVWIDPNRAMTRMIQRQGGAFPLPRSEGLAIVARQNVPPLPMTGRLRDAVTRGEIPWFHAFVETTFKRPDVSSLASVLARVAPHVRLLDHRSDPVTVWRG
ncbi:hypothetical protein [Yinghuangia seranimata]|uniref:hypothetical protein n=1 Tax=Yinghuangia seranimata TaxID=408067 RepID=UPI00248D142C|nr:hypothetical protein [Yinghuangia seranimata]MDI2126728.1 hypothetical protein [Yinghuangia seranimata]